jgi:hypothetical protein
LCWWQHFFWWWSHPKAMHFFVESVLKSLEPTFEEHQQLINVLHDCENWCFRMTQITTSIRECCRELAL